MSERCDALIEQILAIGDVLSSTYSLEEQLQLILAKTREITCSDAGSIYLINRSGLVPIICFEVSQNYSQPERSLNAFAVPMTHQSLVGYVALTGECLNLADAQNLPNDVPYKHHETFDIDIDYCTRSVIVTPIVNPYGEVIGAIQLINRKNNYQSIIICDRIDEITRPFSIWEERLLSSIASQVSICIERKQLLDQLKQQKN